MVVVLLPSNRTIWDYSSVISDLSQRGGGGKGNPQPEEVGYYWELRSFFFHPLFYKNITFMLPICCYFQRHNYVKFIVQGV